MRYSHGELVQLAEEGRRKKMAQLILNLKKLAEEAVDAEVKRRDLVAVVRCKDCIYCDKYSMCWWWNEDGGEHVQGDGFCAWGERRKTDG